MGSVTADERKRERGRERERERLKEYFSWRRDKHWAKIMFPKCSYILKYDISSMNWVEDRTNYLVHV